MSLDDCINALTAQKLLLNQNFPTAWKTAPFYCGRQLWLRYAFIEKKNQTNLQQFRIQNIFLSVAEMSIEMQLCEMRTLYKD